jgi:hypothetical protein
MKVSINQVKINRVGINTAQVRGIRLSSAVADRGHKVDFPFSDSLIDYWNFGGKSNFDKDRTTVTGLLGNVLTAYNFGWNLMSGYGGYNENYLTYSKGANVFVTDDHSITIMNFVPANNWVVSKYGNSALKSTKIKVAGLTSDDQLEYGYSPSNEGARVMMPIPKDGIYDLPESVVNQSTYNIGFFLRSALTKNVTIEQIPLYPGAIVTDGVDDYLKLDKVGYKVGTIIIRYDPIIIYGRWNTVFDCMRYIDANQNRIFLGYSTSINNVGTTLQGGNVGEYLVLKGSNNKIFNVTEPLYLGASYNTNNTPIEFLSMALYSIAIYDRALSDQEVQEVINFINYGTTNPIFALNFDNFAYKAVDYPDFATGKVTTNKIVVDSTTESFTGAIALAKDPEATTGDPIEVSAYKLKVTGIDSYNNPDGIWGIALMPAKINDENTGNWDSPIPIYKDGVYDIPAILKEDRVYNMGIVSQIVINKPIEIEILYDKNITKSFPETKQIFP